jgi:hypothetical protein
VAKKRPASDQETPGPQEAPAAAADHLRTASLTIPSSKASIALWQLEGLAEAIDGMAGLVRDGAAALAHADPRPPEVIGKRRNNPNGTSDYSRDSETGHLVVNLNGRAVVCRERRYVDWYDSFALGDDPRACHKLSGRQIQGYINTAIQNATVAAASLCSEPNCDKYDTRLLLQAWRCGHWVDNEGRHSSALIVSLQLGLTCHP